MRMRRKSHTCPQQGRNTSIAPAKQLLQSVLALGLFSSRPCVSPHEMGQGCPEEVRIQQSSLPSLAGTTASISFPKSPEELPRA